MSENTSQPTFQASGERQLHAGEPPLWQPFYGAPIGKAVARFFRKYVTFSGRASRSEFWWVALFTVVVNVLLSVIWAAVSGHTATSSSPNPVFGAAFLFGKNLTDPLSNVFFLATLIPSIALSVRRLHDTNRSGFWYLIGLVPLVGGIVLLVWFLFPAKPEGQRFDKHSAQVTNGQ